MVLLKQKPEKIIFKKSRESGHLERQKIANEFIRTILDRTLTRLQVPSALLKESQDLLKAFRSILHKGSKYRALRRLIPLCIYYSGKRAGINIDNEDLIKEFLITKTEFQAFEDQINQFTPKNTFRTLHLEKY